MGVKGLTDAIKFKFDTEIALQCDGKSKVLGNETESTAFRNKT